MAAHCVSDPYGIDGLGVRALGFLRTGLFPAYGDQSVSWLLLTLMMVLFSIACSD